jgi:hypothetical protein
VAPFADALQNIGYLGLSLLAVVGGTVAGAVLTAVLVWLACKLFFKRQPPRPVRAILRWLGAVAGALFVAGYLKFGGGTGWLFGEGGPGSGGKSAGEAALSNDVPKAKGGDAKAKDKVADQPPPAQADRLRVVILGGSLVQGRAFYRIEGQREPVDLKAVQDQVRQRRQQSGSLLTAVDILVYQNSLDYNTEPVRQLRAWVTEAGLTPHLVELRGDIPP